MDRRGGRGRWRRAIALWLALLGAVTGAGCGGGAGPSTPIDYSVADVICQDGSIYVLADPNAADSLCSSSGVKTIDYRYHKH